MKASILINRRRELVMPALLATGLVFVTGGTGGFALYASLRLPADATLTIPVWAVGLILLLTALLNGLILFSVFKTLRRLVQERKDEDRA